MASFCGLVAIIFCVAAAENAPQLRGNKLLSDATSATAKWQAAWYNMENKGVDTSPQGFPINMKGFGCADCNQTCLGMCVEAGQEVACPSQENSSADCGTCGSGGNSATCVMEGGNCISCVKSILNDRCVESTWPWPGYVTYPKAGMFFHGSYSTKFNKDTEAPKCTYDSSLNSKIDDFHSKVMSSKRVRTTEQGTFVDMPLTMPNGTNGTVPAIFTYGHGVMDQQCGDCAMLYHKTSSGEEKWGVLLMTGMRAWSLEISESVYFGSTGGGCPVPQILPISCSDVLDVLNK